MVIDESGRLLAGLGIHQEGRLASSVVEHMPLPLQAANAVLQAVPRDGRMRNLVIDKAWFAPGRLDAARYLWEMTRREWRDTATSLLLTHDPPGREAIAYVRRHYDRHSVETPWQRRLVARFG